MSSITTKVGDKGNTRLWSGEEVRKTDCRIVFCGTVDELVSHLGICYHLACEKLTLEDQPKVTFLVETIGAIQKDLFRVASEVATTEPKRSRLENRIQIDDVQFLENEMVVVEESIDPAKGWILPGQTLLSSHLDICRCIARRCERDYIKVMDENLVDSNQALIWLNRLSDFLYILARLSERNNYRMISDG